jgi:hypothetical protein
MTAVSPHRDMTGLSLSIADPLLRRLYEYWLEKKGDRVAPSRGDISPADIVEILPLIYLIEIVGERLRVRLAGTSIAAEMGGNITGKYLDELGLAEAQAAVIAEYQKSARAIVPVASTWKYAKVDGRELDYERVILPLSADGKTVNMFLCGAVGHGTG